MERILGPMWRRVLLFGMLFLASLPGAYKAVESIKGPLDDALLTPLPGNQYVQSRGYEDSRRVMVLLDFGGIVTDKDLLYAQDFARRVEVKLRKNNWIVASLANYPVVRVDEDGFESYEPYIPYLPVGLDAVTFDMQAWREEVRQNPAVYGVFVGKDFKSLIINLEPPADLDDLQVMRQVCRVLEKREIPKEGRLGQKWFLLKEYFQTDCHPVEDVDGPKIHVFSWAFGRGLITAGIARDVFLLMPVGLATLLPLFLFLLLRRARLWLTAWACIVFAVLATVATQYPLTYFNVRMTVYTLAALLGGVLVVAISASTQFAEALEDAEEKGISVQMALVRRIRPALLLIALAGASGFVVFGIALQNLWLAFELEAVFFAGTAWMLVATLYFQPAMYLCFSRGVRLAEAKQSFLHKRLEDIAGWCAEWNSKQGYGKIWVRQVVPIASIVVAVGTYFFFLEVISSPKEYLDKSSNAYSMMNEGTSRGRTDVIPIFFDAPNVPEAMYTERFLRDVLAFSTEVRKVPGVGSVYSMMSQVAYDMEHNAESLEDPKLENAVRRALTGAREIHSRFPERIQHQHQAVVIYADHPMNDADQLAAVIANIEVIAQKYPAYQVHVFGVMSVFPPVVKSFTAGIPQTVIGSLIMLLIVYSFYLRRVGLDGYAWGGLHLTSPFTVAIAVIVSVMAVAGIPMGLDTATIIPIVIAAASDFQVYLVTAFTRHLRDGLDSHEAAQTATKEVGGALLADAIGNTCALILLTQSSFAPVANVGYLAMLGIWTCVIWALLFTLPALADACKCKPWELAQPMEVDYEEKYARIVAYHVLPNSSRCY